MPVWRLIRSGGMLNKWWRVGCYLSPMPTFGTQKDIRTQDLRILSLLPAE
jgi:hypothetical protein